MTFFQRLRETIDATDHFTINRVRIVAALMAALVFGVVLRGQMFSHETLAVSPLASQPALVYQAAESTKIQAEAMQEEGDGLALMQESAQEALAMPDITTATPHEEKIEMPALQAVSPANEGALSTKAYIVARGACGRDTIYEKNAHTQFSPASLTKLMTAVIVAEYTDHDDVVTITPRAVGAEGVAGSLRAGETFSVSDLLHAMLVISSNDAATAFEDHFASQGLDLVALMNEKAIQIGMVHTHFANPTGLDDSDHYASASDLAVLAAYSLQHEQIWDILVKTSEDIWSLNKKIKHSLLSNNELLHKKRSDVMGGKTGYTKNAITVLSSGEVIVVLGSDDRAGDTEQLIELIQHD